MAIIEKESVRKEIKKIYICDYCSKRTGAHNRCCMCDKHVCSDHEEFDWRNGGDYPPRYCKQCWDIGEKYRRQIEAIEMELDIKIAAIEDAWLKEATGQ